MNIRMRDVRWLEDVLSRNGGDRQMNELIKVLQKLGFEKTDKPAAALPKPETIFDFAERVERYLTDRFNVYHKDVVAAVESAGYVHHSNKMVPKVPANPNVLEIDLTGIPVPLQEVFKVHVDLMFGGLLQGEKRQNGVEFMQWVDPSFTANDALQLVFKNILKGHMADASNFLMFIKARGWEVSPMQFKVNLPDLPWDEEPIEVNGTQIPLMRPAQKKPNTAFYTQTHGRNVPDQFISRLKDELFEGKLHWIRTVPGYDDLFHVLALAYDQAARGKGKERHANNKPFAKQPLIELADKFGTGFLLGQAAKKLEECQVLPFGADVKELLGAIVYTAAAVIHLEMNAERNNDPDELDGAF